MNPSILVRDLDVSYHNMTPIRVVLTIERIRGFVFPSYTNDLGPSFPRMSLPVGLSSALEINCSVDRDPL